MRAEGGGPSAAPRAEEGRGQGGVMGRRRAGWAMMAGALALTAAPGGPHWAAAEVLSHGEGDTSFEALVEGTEHDAGVLIAKFYATFCGHCKRLAPHFEAAAEAFAASDPPVTFLDIDVQKNRDLYKQVQEEEELEDGIPRVLAYMGGKTLTEISARDTESIIEEVKTLMSGGATHVSPDELQGVLDKNTMTVVAMFFDSESEADTELAQEAYFDLAKSEFDRKKKLSEKMAYSPIRYFIVDDPGLTRSSELFGVNEPSFAVLKPTDWKSELEDMVSTMPAEGFEEGWGELESFVMGNLAPLALVLTYDNLDHFTSMQQGGGKICKLLVVEEGTPAGDDGKRFAEDYSTGGHAPQTLVYAEELRGIASKFSYSGIQFWVEPAIADVVAEMGFEDVEKPRFGCWDSKDTAAKYRLMDDYSVERVTAFVESILAGEAEPYHISEEAFPPKPKGVNGSFKITARDFAEKVLQSPGDKMVLYHRPGCPHCHRFLPQYRRFAKITPGLDMYEMDIAVNDVMHAPTFSFVSSGIPKAVLYPAGEQNDPKLFVYTGPEESLDGLYEFIEVELGHGRGPPRTDLDGAKTEYQKEVQAKAAAGHEL